MSDLKPGDVVRATCVITDKDIDGTVYIHAIPGDFGVVLEDDFKSTFPVITWGILGEGGTCNTPDDCFEKYRDRVECVVE